MSRVFYSRGALRAASAIGPAGNTINPISKIWQK